MSDETAESRTVFDVMQANDWNEDKAIDSLLDELFGVRSALSVRDAEITRLREEAVSLGTVSIHALETKLMQERIDYLEAQVASVHALHRPFDGGGDMTGRCATDGFKWPCSTARVLAGVVSTEPTREDT